MQRHLPAFLVTVAAGLAIGAVALWVFLLLH
jgi:hypothetical protein